MRMTASWFGSPRGSTEYKVVATMIGATTWQARLRSFCQFGRGSVRLAALARWRPRTSTNRRPSGKPERVANFALGYVCSVQWAGHHCCSARTFAVNPSRLPARPFGLWGPSAAKQRGGLPWPSMQNCARTSPLLKRKKRRNVDREKLLHTRGLAGATQIEQFRATGFRGTYGGQPAMDKTRIDWGPSIVGRVRSGPRATSNQPEQVER